jgi:hypothetical protein
MGGGIKNFGCALVIGWFVLIGTAKAGPPFVTDDPEVPPVGGWEINIPFTLNRTPGSTQMSAPVLDMNYGLPQLQIEFDIPIAVSSDDRKGTNAGLGDLLYGVKWRFFDDEKTQIQFGTYPQMFAPTGNYRRGLGGSLKLNDHLNFIFTGGRDFVGDTHAMLYLGLQIVTKVEK